MGRVQFSILVLCMLLAFFDGYDLGSMALVVPLISREWNISPGLFGWPLAAVLVGAAVGSFTLGWLGDRVGRRPMVIISAIGLGLGSLGTMSAGDVMQLTGWRLLMGVAFGAGMPNLFALVGETVPLRLRIFCTTLLPAATSGGAITGGLVAPTLSGRFGWEGLFFVGGIMTLVIALLMFFFLRESPQALAARGRIRELVATLADFGLDNTNLPKSRPAPKASGGGPIELLRDGLLPITLFYLLGYAMCGFSYYLLLNWLPTLMTHAGWEISAAQRSAALLNAGGLVGGLSLSLLMDRLRRGSLLVPALVFALAAALFVAVGHWLTSSFIYLLLGALAFAISGGQILLPALAVRLYPPSLTATALSWLFPLTRLGGILGSFTGGWMLLAGWSTSRIMIVLSLAPLVSAVACAGLYIAVTRRQLTQLR
jgi:AAHS family 4-hydroxybenzoate transporter-like MFS transporter